MARIVYTDLSGNEQSVPFGPDHPVVTVGRATDCTIRSNRKSVSRRHAEFRYSNGQFEVIDLNSSNGTYIIINEERKPIIGREYLADSDEVWCGDFIIRFYEESGQGAQPPSVSVGGASPPPPPSQGGGQGGWANKNEEEPTAPPRDVSAYQTQPPDGGGVNFGQRNEVSLGNQGSGFSDSLAEESSAAWSHEDDDPPTRQAGVDVQRIIDEKQSIEDLAARQAAEIEDLRTRLEDALGSGGGGGSSEELEKVKEQLEESRSEQSRLEARLHDAMQMAASTSDLNSEIDELTRRNEQLDAEWRAANQRVEELTERLDSSAGDKDAVERLREENVAKDRDIDALEQEVERLRGTMAELRGKVEDAADSERAQEEMESLRMELERHTRLVEEFERRNRALQGELEELREAAENEDALASRVAELEMELESVRGERDEALESAERDREDGEEVEDLKNEVEGLKRRLKMEKERSAEAESEADERIKMLEASLEAASAEAGGEGVDPEVMKEASELVSKLSRIVDAIERADLDALSTVDRVRIQSALRDTEPKATLEKLIEIFSGD